MIRMLPFRLLLTASMLVSWSVLELGSKGFAQESSNLPQLNIVDQLGIPGLSGGIGGDKATFSAKFELVEGTSSGRVSVTAELEPNWHLYSVTQQPGGPQRSVIKLKDEPLAKLAGPFKSNVAPHVKQYDFFDVPVEEHDGEVIWTAPITIVEGFDAANAEMRLLFNGQVCQDEGACIPILNKSIVAKFAGYYEEEAAVTEFASKASHAILRGRVTPATVQPGGTVTLTLTAALESPWHIYAYAEQDPKLISKPTLIAISEPAAWQSSAVAASVAPVEHEMGLEEEPVVFFHETPVTWSMEISVPANTAPGSYAISGLVGYQTCTLSSCDLPTGAKFVGTIEVAEAASNDSLPLTFTSAKYTEAAKLAAANAADTTEQVASVGFDRTQLTITDDTKEQPLWAAIGIALAGGFILNFMPCVLPVIGLKIMSFVQQAGESRARAFALNLWYSLGLMTVFMVLATMAAVWSVGWGQQNQSSVFNIVMASVVFTMGLSFLGVWEIPIPGFVGTGKANDLAAQEGASGAFAKGIVTTILAVPCSGPLVATALTWCSGKPPALVYLTFGCMGLGMAAPYLLIGAYPALMRFMPKPGAWMDTFKQAMGFVLLGTVVWILSYLPWSQVLPTMAFLFGLWAACWWIGRTSLTADLQTKARAWIGALAFATGIGMFAYMWFDDVMALRFTAAVERQIAEMQFAKAPDGVGETGNQAHSNDSANHLPWQPFSLERLQEFTAQQRTVMVDFTADWCPTCKVLEVKSLNTESVKAVVEDNEVVTLLADWTNPNTEISEMLELLGSKQIPVLAIFPADRPNEPIVLRGWYSTDTLVEKLQQAGPSKVASSSKKAASVAAVVQD